MHDRDIDLHLNSQCPDGRLGDEGLRLMHLVPAPAVRLSCKDECYPDQALTVYWLKDNMRLVCHSSLLQSSSLSFPFSFGEEDCQDGAHLSFLFSLFWSSIL